jgi:hypothetical protein
MRPCDRPIPKHDYRDIGDGFYRCAICTKVIHLEVVPFS